MLASPLPSMKSVDPLVELIRQLHEQAGNSDMISLEEAKKLLEDCDFEDGLRQHVIEEFKFGIVGAGPIKTEHFLRKVKEAEKFYGKQRHAEPILANLKLMSDFGNPWNGKLGGAEFSGTTSKPTNLTAFKGSGDEAAFSFTIDLNCIHISIQEVSGAVFKHVNYKLELCYGVYGGGEHYVNSVVIRRYSDFSWLHSYLSSKFPFRAVPPIPPKRLIAPTAAAELELANDRLLHLNSFLICLLMHPIFAKDSAVRAFFSDPRSFSDWTLNNPDADITEEYRAHEQVIQEPEDDAEFSDENLVNIMLPDDPLFQESSRSLELLGDVLKHSMDCSQNIYRSYENIVDGSRLMLNQFALVESMYTREDIESIHISLTEIVRNNEEKLDELKHKVRLRMATFQCMTQGLKECLVRLQTQTYADFVGLAGQLAMIQAQIDRLRLQDGPNVQSTEQIQLCIQKKRLQKLYLYHHYRNDWSVSTVRRELEAFAHNWLGELLKAVKCYAELK